MSRSLILILMVFISIESLAQVTFLGIRIGTTQNRINVVKPTESLEIVPEYSWTTGFIIGKKFNRNIGLWIGSALIKKSYSEKKLESFKGVVTTYKNLYVQLPLQISYEYKIGKFYPVIKGGLFCSYWLQGKNSGLIPDIFSTTGIIQPGGTSEQVRLVKFNNKRNFSSMDRRIETGAIITIELGYKINKVFRAVLNYDYMHSFTSMSRGQDLNYTKRYNRTSVFSMGLMYELRRKN